MTMFKKPLSAVGLTLVAVLSLAACNTGTIEEPEVVLEKALTTISNSAETEASLSFSLNDPTMNGSYEAEFLLSDKSSMEDLENPQSESTMSFTASGEVEGQDLEASGSLDLVLAGDDIYVTMDSFDLSGSALGGMDAFILPAIKAYTDQTYHLNLEEFSQLIEDFTGEEVATTDYDLYQDEEFLQAIADTKFLVVEDNHGVVQIETVTGDNVNAYHYTIGLDGANFESLMRMLNEKMEIMPEAEIDFMFRMIEEEGYEMSDVVDVLSEGFELQMWIGQDDYHVYKSELITSSEHIVSLMEAVDKLDPGTVLDREYEMIEDLALDVTAVLESAPIDAFEAEVPDDFEELDEVIEGLMMLGMAPMIESPTDLDGDLDGFEAMSDEELEALMEAALSDPALTEELGEELLEEATDEEL